MRGIFVGFVVLVALVGVRGGNLVLKGKGKDKQGEDQEWWQSSVLYQIYPRSFMDSDGDGVGDIKGITSKLDYLVELGIRSVWLSPVYESPMKDFGYDISNFTNIDPIFGTLEDFFEMQEAMKDRGIKLVMDLVPNHSSDQHEWFNRSLAGEAPYDDYYVWVDPKFDDEGERQPPSNWLSVFGGSAWTYREEREQYFLHQFLPEQPDVNGYNENLIQALSDVFQFWLDMGVDGFRVDAIKHFAEIEDYYQDEAESGIPDLPEGNYENLYHNLTTNQQQTFDVLRRWRLLLDAATEASGSPKIMMTEVTGNDLENVMLYYGTEEEPIAHYTFNFVFISALQAPLTADTVRGGITTWIDSLPDFAWSNWVIGNHDNHRVASRFGSELVDAVNMIVLLLPGTAVTYYGEEIGMEDTFISYEDTQDPAGCFWGPDLYQNYSRDPERTPMQWNDEMNAGFSTSDDTWLPVNENYPFLNVELQREDPESHLNVYKILVALRSTNAHLYGELDFPNAVNTEDIFVFTRMYPVEGEDAYIIVVNFGEDRQVLNLNSIQNLGGSGVVLARSGHETEPGTEHGSTVDFNAVPIGSKVGLVISSPFLVET